jgi:hypothetical protein
MCLQLAIVQPDTKVVYVCRVSGANTTSLEGLDAMCELCIKGEVD